jgi:hypothetical protein
MQPIQPKVLFEKEIVGFNEQLVRILTERLKKAFHTDLFIEEHNEHVKISQHYMAMIHLLAEQLRYDEVIHRPSDISRLLERADGIIATFDHYLEKQEVQPLPQTQVLEEKPLQTKSGGCPVCRQDGINWEEKYRECYSCGIRGDEFDAQYV